MPWGAEGITAREWFRVQKAFTAIESNHGAAAPLWSPLGQGLSATPTLQQW